MPQRVYQRDVVMTGDWVALASESTVLNWVVISCPSENAANVTIRDKDHTENSKVWVPGEWHRFEHFDLATLEASGEADDTVSLVGQAGGL